MSRPSRRAVIAGAAALAPLALAIKPRAQAAPKPARPLADRLARYADHLRYEDIDAAAIEAVKIHFIDTLGCGIAALAEPPVRICREVALATAGGAATVIGTDRRTSAELATFANGAAFRYYDLNDIYVHRQGAHPSDHIAACLAVAEAERASAHELIAAIVLAYEVNCRFVDAVDLSTGGWDPPVLSLPAVALAAGKLMKLDVEKLTQAVNLAINDHIPMFQTRVQTLSDWKGLADAEAGRNAVFAAQLARGGISGPAPIFEGRAGFFKQVSGPVTIDVDAFGGPGIPFKVTECNMKAYPAVVYAQTAIAAGIEVAKGVGDLHRNRRRPRSRPPAAAIRLPAAKRKNGRRRTAPRPITACRTRSPGQWPTARSPTRPTRPRSSMIRRSSASWARSRCTRIRR